MGTEMGRVQINGAHLTHFTPPLNFGVHPIEVIETFVNAEMDLNGQLKPLYTFI